MTIRSKYDMAWERIRSFHLKEFPGRPGKVFLISTTYPGVWLEHVYDAVMYAQLEPGHGPEIARNQTLLFLNAQKEDGHLPYNVLDRSIVPPGSGRPDVGYSHIQECVSLGRLCLMTYRMLADREYLKKAYRALAGWDKWLRGHRMTTGQGLIELFCLWDTGHDNSARLKEIPNNCPDPNGCVPADAEALPILAPDMNAVFYGDLCALAEMAEELGLPAEAREWELRAKEVRTRMLDLLWDPADEFFYDVDRFGRKRKSLSCQITNVLTEHVPDRAMADRIITRHLDDTDEFAVPYPLPSLAVCDPGSVKDLPGNSWGYYSQALTALRCSLWADDYGFGDRYDMILGKWVEAVTRSERNFSQELDPFTGEMSESSEWYSSCMLLYIYAVRRLHLLG